MGCRVPAASSGGTHGAPLLLDEPEEPNQAGGAKPHGNGYWLCQSGLRVHRVDARIPAVAWRGHLPTSESQNKTQALGGRQ